MFWTLELASSLDDAPWPATKEELIDYATRTCAPDEVIENLEELDDDNAEIYEYLKISNLRASGTVFTDRARWHFMAFYGILGKRK